MIRTGIIGGSHFQAGELIRLLINHPDVEISWIHSSDNAGRRITDIHRGLIGECYLRFTDNLDVDNIDMLFLCMNNGEARNFILANPLPETLKIIDLSSDFRLADQASDFVYGLPELNRKPMVRGALHVANPGNIATAVSLALLPLAKELRVEGDIHVTAITATSDADTTPAIASAYSSVSNNITLFNPLTHSQLPEINQTIRTLSPNWNGRLNLIPLLGPISRGTVAIVYMDSDLDANQAQQIFEDYYSDHNFTFLSDTQPDIKDVVNTNKCILHIDKIDNKLVITSVIDNLLKGCAGTAIHNMNLLFGLQERVGLLLKSSAF